MAISNNFGIQRSAAPTAAARTAPAAATTTTEAAAATSSDSIDIGNASAAPAAAAPAPAAPKPTQLQIDGPAQPLPAPLPQKKWTVMLWSASDNNLYRFMQDDIDEAERVGTTPNMNVIVQTDHAKIGGGAKRYELQADDKPMIHSPVRADLGPTNMADPKQLSDFIQWTAKNYPAENYMLIMSDHGGGPDGACEDDSANGWMTPGMIKDGLKDAQDKTGVKLAVLGFDACLMANAEVAHELKDVATYLVGSEETEGGAGWQYDQTLTNPKAAGSTEAPIVARQTNRIWSAEMLQGADTAMRSRSDFTPKEFASNIVAMAAGHQGDLGTMTAFDTAKIQGITDATKTFGQAILDTQVPLADLKAAKNAAQGFYEYKDLSDFASQIAKRAGSDEALKNAAGAVKSAISDAIIAEQHSTKYPNANGMTIELNQHRETSRGGASDTALPPNFNPEKAERISFGSYKDLQFVKDTGWDKVQDKLAQKVPGMVENNEGGMGNLGGISNEQLSNMLGSMSQGELEALLQALLTGQTPQNAGQAAAAANH